METKESVWSNAYKKCIALLNIVYEDGDYGFSCYHIGHISCLLTQLYFDLDDHGNGLIYLEKGLDFSKKYDDLPKEIKHSSLLVKDDFEDMSEVSQSSRLNRVAYEVEEFSKFVGCRNLPGEYSDILHKYEPFKKNL